VNLRASDSEAWLWFVDDTGTFTSHRAGLSGPTAQTSS
jgi:hypothetical protein